MKETLGKILRIFTTVLMVLSICMMIFTVISVLTFNRSDRQLLPRVHRPVRLHVGHRLQGRRSGAHPRR